MAATLSAGILNLPPIWTVSFWFMTALHQQILDCEQSIRAVYLGRAEAVRQAVLTVLAGGHLLIEDVPGIGKTTLALALSRVFDLPFRRIQMTSDLLPADIIGVSIFEPHENIFRFRPGPIFANVLLVDELNRATPKTQSALLEAMAEGFVSADGVTHALPEPYVVLATQNPIEQHGTFPLPESQLDRFLLRIRLGYPEAADEVDMLLQKRYGQNLAELSAIVHADTLLQIRQDVSAVTVHPEVAQYITAIVHATRESPDTVAGVSPRGSLALAQVARAVAWMDERDFVRPDDVYDYAIQVCAHRIVVGDNGTATSASVTALQEELMLRILEGVPAPV